MQGGEEKRVPAGRGQGVRQWPEAGRQSQKPEETLQVPVQTEKIKVSPDQEALNCINLLGWAGSGISCQMQDIQCLPDPAG